MKPAKYATIALIIMTLLVIMLPAGHGADTYLIRAAVGDVKVIVDGKAHTAAASENLAGGETIVTGNNSMADLIMGQKGFMRIQENSRVAVSSLMKDDDRPDLDMNSGSILVILTRLVKGGSYEVKTPTQVAAVRGTIFQVSGNDNQSQLDVLAGSVLVNPVVNGVAQRKFSQLVSENQSLTLNKVLVLEILSKKKNFKLSAMRREIKDTILKHMAHIRQSPEFQNFNKELKNEINERILKIKQEINDKKLDRESLKERLKQEQERLREQMKTKENK